MAVKKLVLPVAGLGKRLVHLTAHVPKALVTVGGKPLLSRVLEEAEEGGIREVALVVRPDSRRHFEEYLSGARRTFPDLTFTVFLQDYVLGNGAAIAEASEFIHDEPFAVRFCDDLFVGEGNAIGELGRLFESERAPLVALERRPLSEASRYGVIEGTSHAASLIRITRIVEKPHAAHEVLRGASSIFIAVGAFIFTPEVMDNLVRAAKNAAREMDGVPWTKGVQPILSSGGAFYGWEFPWKRLDCGTLHGIEAAEDFLRKKEEVRA